MWGQTVSNIGQQIGQGIQQFAETKESEKKAKALKAQDAAFMERLSSGQPLTPNDAVGIYGPDRGIAIYKAYETLQGEKPDLPTTLAGFDASSPDMRAMAWPGARNKLVGAGMIPETVPEQYDHDWYEKAAPSWRKGAPQTKPIEVSPGATLYDPTKGEAVFTAPKPNDADPRVVGRSLVGPDGKVIYRDPEAPRSDAEPLVAVIGDDGQPVMLPRSLAVGRRPASNREQGRPVTSGDAGRIAELDTSLDDLNTLTETLTGSSATGTAAKVGAMLPNWVTEWTGAGSSAKKKQAVIDRVKQVIGKALEGGVLRKEDELKYEKILPTIGDTPEVVAVKLDGLFDAIQQRRSTTLDALSDAGYDVTKYTSRPPRERKKADSGDDGWIDLGNGIRARRKK